MRNRAQVGNINPPAAVPAHRLRRNFTVVMLYTPPIARITQRIKLTTGCNAPMIFLFALPFPVLVALYLGWRAGRRDPQGFREFWTHAAAALAWGFAVVFLWHCLWITSLIPAPWQETALSGAIWTVGTGAVWVPILMIFYVITALKIQRME